MQALTHRRVESNEVDFFFVAIMCVKSFRCIRSASRHAKWVLSLKISSTYACQHMQIMEGDLIRTMAANMNRIGHIQFADNPGRHEPGTGEINYPQVFAAIDAMGYRGYVGAEYTPSTRTEDTLGWRQA